MAQTTPAIGRAKITTTAPTTILNTNEPIDSTSPIMKSHIRILIIMSIFTFLLLTTGVDYANLFMRCYLNREVPQGASLFLYRGMRWHYLPSPYFSAHHPISSSTGCFWATQERTLVRCAFWIAQVRLV